MERPTVAGLAAALKDPAQEGMMYDQIQGIRNRIHPPIDPDGKSRTHLISESVVALGKIVPHILAHTNEMAGDAGHGQGHQQRDYMHALRLAMDESLPIECVIPTMLAGTLHDIGTLFVDRYAERHRAVRHAEAGALIVRAAALETGTMTAADADLIAFCIAAHTHYQEPSEVACADGKTRKIEPYPVMRGDNPMLEAWIPRWVDRLDCSGPCVIGRHYLTLANDHDDYSREHGFYRVSFAEHMRPLFRTKEEIAAAGGAQTMTEHFRMFSSTQTNDSPYGRYDRGQMVDLRDTYRAMLERVLEGVTDPRKDLEIKKMSLAWHLFLAMNIEPSPRGRQAMLRLEGAFEELDTATQSAWINGFTVTLQEYSFWSSQMMKFLETLPKEYLTMHGAYDDIRETVCPHTEWSDLLVL